MAKICACCGAKISFFDEEYYLPYEEATVCVNCGQMIEPLLKDIKNCSDQGQRPQSKGKV